MEKAFAKAEELVDHVKQYVNNRIESAKLSTAEKSSAVIATLIAGATIAVVFIFFLIFAGVALSIGLGEWLGIPWLGFLIMALFYLLVGVVVWIARSRLIQLPIIRLLLKQLFNNKDHD
jgi:hypothetical protein